MKSNTIYRLVAVRAIMVERERQDSKHGFDPTRPLGFGKWWARGLDVFAHWLYERAKKRGTLTWAHTLFEEVAEVLAARSPGDVRKELRQVAAVCVKTEEAMAVAGLVQPSPEEMDEHTEVWSALLVESYREQVMSRPYETRTLPDCWWLLGAFELAVAQGADPMALEVILSPADIGQHIARLFHATPVTRVTQ